MLKKLFFTGLIIIVISVGIINLPACQPTNKITGSHITDSTKASPIAIQVWQIDGIWDYSTNSIWGDNFVGLEIKRDDRGELVQQSIAVYNLRSCEKNIVMEISPFHHVTPPSIYESKVVWASNEQGNWDIFMVDINTHRINQITTNNHDQVSPRIYGDIIVWLDNRHERTNLNPQPFDVYAYDILKGRESRITLDSTVEGYDSLSINGDLIVWTDIRNASTDIISHQSNDPYYNNEIFVFDLKNNKERRITNSPVNDQCPVISGNYIAWLRRAGYKEADIFLYDLKSGKETQISHSNYATFSPSIYDNRIVWTDARFSYGNTSNDVIINGQEPSTAIYLYDLDTQQEIQITLSEASKVWISPIIYGDILVYKLSRQIGSVVYVANLANN